ncbi:hypothetical protein DY000_02047708 [Brassica cretica]|uniref:Uncharacterized protein n=1 Tax=Brassica cretica TaxID=69181 RepID=A0ABQ7ESA8_BRACR|nr:hypothetical protein DY000_02047708 [Brassica cretica]
MSGGSNTTSGAMTGGSSSRHRDSSWEFRRDASAVFQFGNFFILGFLVEIDAGSV